MTFKKKSVPAWIKQAFDQSPDLWECDYLVRAIESVTMAESRWEQLHQVVKEKKQDSEAALHGLSWVLRYAVNEFMPARQLTPKQRKGRAEKFSKKASALAADLESLNVHPDWRFHQRIIRDRMIETARSHFGINPTDVVQRTLPEFRKPVLRNDWEEGVHATIDALPELLKIVAATLSEWGAGSFDEPWVGRPNNQNADRTFFLKVLTDYFVDLYDAPLRGVTLDLGAAFFPDAPAIDMARLTEIAPLFPKKTLRTRNPASRKKN